MTSDAVLMERASEITGLSDFGDSDEFRTGLGFLLVSLGESDLPPESQALMHDAWVGSLATRLRLVELRQQRPEIAAQEIEGPVAVIGLPRTGTSALVDLLAQDPAARAPLQWETVHLFPPANPELGRLAYVRGTTT